MSNTWNAANYDTAHSYVWTMAGDMIDLLAPIAGEQIIDLGSGTGHLTAQIAHRGANVVGLDSSAEMVDRAKQNYPNLDFRVANATDFELGENYDAVFSNATLHWVKDARAAVKCIHRALRPRGRFVAEFGGSKNVQTIMKAIAAGLNAVSGPRFESLSPWYYPTIGQYAAILEAAGFELTFARLFDRPTPIEAGLRSWIELYGTIFLNAIATEKRETFFTAAEEFARPKLYKDGKWVADYRRLRIAAVRVG